MKFLPTIEATTPGVYAAIRTGALRLQRGQWVRFNVGDRPSRFVRRSASSIWAAHYPRTGPKSFSTYVAGIGQ